MTTTLVNVSALLWGADVPDYDDRAWHGQPKVAGSEPCARSGRWVKPGSGSVVIITGGGSLAIPNGADTYPGWMSPEQDGVTFVTDTGQSATGFTDAGFMGCYSVGSDCARKFPAGSLWPAPVITDLETTP